MLIAVVELPVKTQPPVHSDLMEQVHQNTWAADRVCLFQLQALKPARVPQSAAEAPCTLIHRSEDWRRKDDARAQQNDKTCQPASGEL